MDLDRYKTQVDRLRSLIEAEESAKTTLQSAADALRQRADYYARIGAQRAHRVIAERMLGRPLAPGEVVHHRDGNKRNNDPRNLEVVTGAENIRHSYANGRPRPWAATRAAGGTWRGKPLVSAESIATARAMRAGGALLREVAAHLGLSVTHTQRLIAGGA